MRLFLFTLFLIPIQILAAPLIVDGPGDGDNDGTDDLDSVRAALLVLEGGSGTDGTPDVIHIMVDAISESEALYVNGRGEPFLGVDPIHDDLTIEGDADGNGIRCVLDIVPSFETIFLILADGQNIELRDLILILKYNALGIGDFITVKGTGEGAPFIGSSFTIDHVMITASLASGDPPVSVPRDPDDFTSGGARIWDDDDGAGIHLENSYGSSGHPVDVRIIDTVVAHQLTNGIVLEMETGSAEITNTRVINNGYVEPGGTTFGNGIHAISIGEMNVTVMGSSAEFNYHTGMSLGVSGYSNVADVTVGPGCYIANNVVTGASIGTQGSANIIGTRENPIRSVNNRFRTGVGDDQTTLTLRHVIFSDGFAPLSLRADNVTDPQTVEVSNCLFSRGHFSVEDPTLIHHYDSPGYLVGLGGPVVVSIEECTFHEAEPHPTYPSAAQLINPSPLGLEFTGLATFADCIFSGDGDELLLDTTQASDSSFDFSNCAIVMEGDHALGAINSTGQGTINMTDCIFIDPQYVNVNAPPDEDSFDVNATFYGHAGPGDGPLSGWGDYVGEPYDGGGAGIEVH